jgi:hypothetical protein
MSSKNLNIHLPNKIEIENKQYQKYIFLSNALDEGWSVKKSEDSYIFTKKHENRKEIFRENYLENFLISNLSKNSITFNK